MSQLNIKIQPLDKDNYDTWKVQVKALLIKGDTWGYASGEKQRPAEGEAAISQWTANDAKAMSDLILAISPTELKHVKTCTTSREIWRKLQSIYESQGPARKAMLLKNLIHLKMKNGDDMRTHLANFFDIVDKLEDLELKINPELVSILMLYSVPENYEPFRIAIETREKLPMPEELKIKLLEEFQSRKRVSAEEDSTSAMLVSKQYRGKRQGAHTPLKNNDKFKNVKCFKCDKLGHISRNCRKPSNSKKEDKEESKYSEAMTACAFSGNVHHDTADILKPQSTWYLDSGASSHMCRDRSAFEEIRANNKQTLKLATMDSTKICGTGVVKLKINNEVTAALQNTLFIPDLRSNLLSVAKMTDYGHEVTFKKDGATVVNTNSDKIIEAKRVGDLYIVPEASEFANIANVDEKSWQELHKKFGHLNMKDLKFLVNREYIHGIKVTGHENFPTCEVCVQGKLARIPFEKSTSASSEVLQLIHTDICGPMRVSSLSGSKYFMTFVDDKTRYCEIAFLKHKSDAFEKFMDFKMRVEKKTGKKIKVVRSDNGREYLSEKFKQFFRREGIEHQLSAEYTPEQNGVAERFNRTVVEMARCMLLESRLPPTFWAEAIATACYIRNRCPTRTLHGNIPYTAWTGKVPTAAHFRIFGTTAHMLEKGKNLGKFDSKTRKCIFIGYSLESKAYRLWDPVAKRVLKSRDVKFLNGFQSHKYEVPDNFVDINVIMSICNRENNFVAANDEECEDENEEFHSANEENTYERGHNKTIFDENDDTDVTGSQPVMKPGRGRPRKIRTGKPGRPAKRKCEVSVSEVRRNENESEENDNEDDDQEEIINNENNVSSHEFAGLVSGDPISVEQALNSPEAMEWKEAMQEEINALINNETWTIVERPWDKRVTGSKWVLCSKLNADGSTERKKARLVARGFSQQKGLDYFETFAPVARAESVRMVMALAAENGLTVHQLDFVSAYLNGEIKEELYLEIPDFFSEIVNNNETPKPLKNKVFRLNKALYGLKQSGRCWFMKLDEKLKKMSFKQLSSDHCVYYQRGRHLTIVVIYVDDLIIASDSIEILKKIKKELSVFKMKDFGPINQCLGIKFQQDRQENRITMSQRKLIERILQNFKMEDCKPAPTPLNPSMKLTKAMSPKNEEEREEMSNIPYRNLIGSLMYVATSTRPDIMHAVSLLSQFNEDPGPEHWKSAKRVLRYLQGTKDLKLVFEKTGMKLVGFADADWGSNTDDRRSYTGYFFQLANAAVSWSSRKQKSVALSSTEAEYMSLSETAKEAIHLRKFLEEILGLQQQVIIYNDNQGAGHMTRNPVHHGRAKHIDIRYHHIRDIVEAGMIKVEYQPTEEMPADALTKALTSEKHNKCMKEMGLRL